MGESAKRADKPGSVEGSHSSRPGIAPTALATYPRARRDASSLADLVLLPVEVAAFHPRSQLTLTSGLVSVALFLAFGVELSPQSLYAGGYYPLRFPVEPGLSSTRGPAIENAGFARAQRLPGPLRTPILQLQHQMVPVDRARV